MKKRKKKKKDRYSLAVYLDAYEAGCLIAGLICGLADGEDGEGDFTVRGMPYHADADAETGTILIMPKSRGLNLAVERILQKLEDDSDDESQSD